VSGGALATAVTGAILAYGGAAFARMGWRGLRRPFAPAAPGRELAPRPSGASPAWKLLWLAALLFGTVVIVCGLLLLIAPFLPERGASG
jgi:hypothetical protein